MKMTKHSVERVGDKLTLRVKFVSQMRTPVSATITMKSGDTYDDNDVVMQGDVKDVMGALNSFAEIAWAEGWRPRNLGAHLQRLVETYKEPPVVR